MSRVSSGELERWISVPEVRLGVSVRSNAFFFPFSEVTKHQRINVTMHFPINISNINYNLQKNQIQIINNRTLPII